MIYAILTLYIDNIDFSTKKKKIQNNNSNKKNPTTKTQKRNKNQIQTNTKTNLFYFDSKNRLTITLLQYGENTHVYIIRQN